MACEPFLSRSLRSYGEILEEDIEPVIGLSRCLPRSERDYWPTAMETEANGGSFAKNDQIRVSSFCGDVHENAGAVLALPEVHCDRYVVLTYWTTKLNFQI